MAGNASDTLGHLAGYGVGALSALTSIKGGGLQNWLLNRQRAVEDPNIRASLVGSPFASGMLLQSGGDVAAPGTMPAAGGVAAPDDIRWLQAQNPARQFVPNLPPLAAEQQVQTQAAQGIISGTQSADPVIRANAKLAGKIPLTPDEQVAGLGWGRYLQRNAGPGGTVGVEVPGMPITIGSPYIGGQYLDYDSAVARAKITGGQVAPAPGGGFEVTQPQVPAEHEYMTPELAHAALIAGEKTVPSGRTVNGIPTYVNVKEAPTGVSTPGPPAAQPAGVPTPGAPPPARKAPAAPAPPPPLPAAKTPPPPPPPPPEPPPRAAAPSPAPAPEGAAPQPPQPPPPPPAQILIQRPDGSFVPAPKAPPAQAPRPRAEAAPTVAPPMLAAGAPPLFQFPGAATPAPEAAPVMVASAAPPPYQVVPGAELSGVVSGAPPAPAEVRAAQPPPAAPAPTAAVPWTPEQPGQPNVQVGAPTGLPSGGGETYTVTKPIIEGGKESGSVTVSGETPAGRAAKLDALRQNAEMQKSVENRFGNLPEGIQSKLNAAYDVRRAVNKVLSDYTPDQRAGYLGYLQPYVSQFWPGSRGDPRYQRFLHLNDDIRSAMAGAGAPKEALDSLPTGMERTAGEYEAALRSAADRADEMITGVGLTGSMHGADLTPAKQQQAIEGYVSRNPGIHYGPYPWDEQTGLPISAETTTTSPASTTTTLYPVDVRHTVAPSQ